MVLRVSPGIDLSDTGHEEKFILKSAKYKQLLNSESVIVKNSDVWIKFSGIDSIEKAYKLIGYKVFLEVPRSVIQENNLIGYEVVDLKGNSWGTVIGIDKKAMNSLLKTNLNGTEKLIPFFSPVIVRINKKDECVIIDPPEGLMDLNL